MQTFAIGDQVPPSCVVVETSRRQKKQTLTMIRICSTASGPTHRVGGGWEDPCHLRDNSEGGLAKLNSLDMAMNTTNV